MEINFDKYGSRGEGYHWDLISNNPLRKSAFVVGRYAKSIELLRMRLGKLDGMSVMDFGCGDGAFSWALTRAGARVTGVDSSDVAIAYAQRRHGALATHAQFYCENCYETHFPDASFDGLVSTDVIEHVQHTDRFLREIVRILKPGGIAVVTTPIRLTEQPLDCLHVAEWFPSEFEEIIRGHFATASFYKSHPTIWHEVEQRSKLLRVLVNVFSLFGNPYLRSKKWHIYSQQYAVCEKAR
ncbi:MAG: class I SAM-dependent methyltransferase [Pseudomonadota bacterium]